MCLRAVIMLHYLPAGLGDRLGAWPRSRSAGWRIWVLEAPGACRKAAWRSWPSSSRAGQGGSEGHGSGSSRLLAALQVSAAQRPRSPRPLARCLPSPPPASSLILQAACQEGPGRAQACSRARDLQGRPGRRGQEAALRAPLCAGPRRPQRLYPCPAGPPRVRPAPLGSSQQTFRNLTSSLGTFSPQSPNLSILSQFAQARQKGSRGPGS